MATRPSAREEERLARLAGYRILGTPPEPAFDDLARRAQEAVRAPMAWLAFDDGRREWVKAGVGIDFTELVGARRLACPAGAPPARGWSRMRRPGSFARTRSWPGTRTCASCARCRS